MPFCRILLNHLENYISAEKEALSLSLSLSLIHKNINDYTTLFSLAL